MGFSLTLFQHGLSMCCNVRSSMGCSMDICSGMALSVGCREVPAPVWSPPQAADDFLLQQLDHILPSFFPHRGDCRVVPHTQSTIPTQSVLPFLKHIFPDLTPRVSPILAEGPSCVLRWVSLSQLELAVSSMGQPEPLLTETTLAAPGTSTLTPATAVICWFKKTYNHVKPFTTVKRGHILVVDHKRYPPFC